MHENEEFPTLILYEHCNYQFHSSGGDFSITELNSSLYEGSDIFQNSVNGSGEYIFFSPDSNTPRTLLYQNLAFPSNNGTILVKAFEELALLKMESPKESAALGTNLVITDDLSIFASAPQINDNEGVVCRFIHNNDGNYIFDHNVTSPDSGPGFFGSSLSYDKNSSSLLIGAPNAHGLRGNIYKYSIASGGITSVAVGGNPGDFLGWSAITGLERIFIGSLAVNDSLGGYLSILDASTVPPASIFQSLRPPTPQFGNEFTYSLFSQDDFLVVGAPGEDDLTNEDTGAVYLIQLNEESYNTSKILSSNRSEGSRFGHVVWIDGDLIYVSAPYGDGAIPNSGVIHVFSFNDETLNANKVYEIFPPDNEEGVRFGQNMIVHGDFVFVSAPAAQGAGMIYIFKRTHQESLVWNHVNSIELNQFSANLSTSEKIPLAVNQGYLAIGLNKESTIEEGSGAVQILYNPAWDLSSLTQLPPFFENNDIIEVNVLEDSGSVGIDFNGSIPNQNSNQIYWEVRPVDENISQDRFDINATSGKFIFDLPQDFSGSIRFEVSATFESQKYSHLFDVIIEQEQDTPIFLDFNFTEGLNHLLPNATVDENYYYLFNTFDPDGDNLEIRHYGELPSGLEISDLSLEGSPLFSTEGNYTFTIGLWDGSNEVNQSFTMEVFPENSAPEVSFLGQNMLSPSSINLDFSENFSLTQWQDKIRTLEVSDAETNLTMVVVNYPLNGFLNEPVEFDTFDDDLIRYTPKLNFSGSDSFSIRFIDKHPVSPKYFDLTFILSIESENSPPFITSPDPPETVLEGEYFEHVFEIFDAEEDFFYLSFENLPSWLNFDGVRRIFGKPQRKDYVDLIEPFFISVTDQWGSTHTKKLEIGVIPHNYPPALSHDDENVSLISISLDEDSAPAVFSLSAYNSDNPNTSLLWDILKKPLNGEVTINSQESTNANFSYSPDGNFSGYDFLQIDVFEEGDSLARDSIKVEFYVISKPDPPKFASKPFPGIVYNRPWIYEIHGIDGDQNDKLTLKSLVNLPDWLKLTQTGNRTWTFKGQPTNRDEEIPIALNLSDQNTSVDQNFTLKVLESLDDLKFNLSDELSLAVNPESPNRNTANVYLDEDSNWSLDILSVNSISDIRVRWELVQKSENGNFTYHLGENGEIKNLSYVPDQHFFGFDKIELKAFDNYSETYAEINFHIQSIEDPVEFYDYPTDIIESENEIFDFFISYQDGDGLETLNEIEFFGLPEWLSVESHFFNEFSHVLRLFGEPKVEDIGEFNITARISEKEGNETQIDFDLEVNFLNKPPVPSPAAISITINEDSHSEDSPKKWTDYFSVSDEETASNELVWSVVSHPINGTARIDENGKAMTYFPDANYSGDDFFTVGVMDRGGANNSLPRQTIVPVSIEVLQENDLPVFETLPPSDSNDSFFTTWNDEREYYYKITVLDSDWSWQGYPKVSLQSGLPQWANWKDLGNGSAVLSGSPMWFHEGVYSFSVVAQSGADVIVQNFDLEIVVDDYPPRVLDSLDQLVYNKIQIFVLEDGSLDDVENSVKGLRAFNPDKVAGETLRWLLFTNPTSDGNISLISEIDQEKTYATISEFSYQIPANYYGIDRFSLIVDEGDRQTEVPFEINIKAIPDPPFFLEGGSLSMNLVKGSYFERDIIALDPDGQSVDFRILYPANNSKWLTIVSEKNDADGPSVKIGGIVPQDLVSEAFTLIASDPTGRFSMMELIISANP